MLFILVILTLIYIPQHNCSLASEKCLDYSKAVYVERSSPTLTASSRKNLVSECGIVSVPLIIGGTQATVKEFPHMALLGFGESPDSELLWQCGGSLISDIFVLTAAHCLQSRAGLPQKVKLGIVDLCKPDSNMQERVITDRIPNPEYKPATKENDIALLKLAEPVQFTPFVRPACLNEKEISPGAKTFATGFGKTSYLATNGSRVLMKVLLSVYDNAECSKIVNRDQQIVDTMLCVGELNGGKDTCQGDSGGPLQVVLEEPYCMYSIIGVTSFGRLCGFANSPAIYTNVAKFLPWIENTVWKN